MKPSYVRVTTPEGEGCYKTTDFDARLVVMRAPGEPWMIVDSRGARIPADPDRSERLDTLPVDNTVLTRPREETHKRPSQALPGFIVFQTEETEASNAASEKIQATLDAGDEEGAIEQARALINSKPRYMTGAMRACLHRLYPIALRRGIVKDRAFNVDDDLEGL